MSNLNQILQDWIPSSDYTWHEIFWSYKISNKIESFIVSEYLDKNLCDIFHIKCIIWNITCRYPPSIDVALIRLSTLKLLNLIQRIYNPWRSFEKHESDTNRSKVCLKSRMSVMDSKLHRKYPVLLHISRSVEIIKKYDIAYSSQYNFQRFNHIYSIT